MFINLAKRCQKLFGWVPRIEAGPGKGLRFEVGPATSLFVSGKYEIPVQERLSSLVKPGAVFYDVGANMGFFSVLAGRLVGPSGKVYAFEPVPRNAAIVKKNADLNRLTHIEVLRIALSDQIGGTELLLADHPGGAVLKCAGTPPDMAGSITVEAKTVDNLVQSGEIRPPDVVKIDVEGAEMQVLRGMVKVLQENSPAMLVEIDDETEARCEAKLAVCRGFLETFLYETEVIPNSYTDGKWFVRHFVGLRKDKHQYRLRKCVV